MYIAEQGWYALIHIPGRCEGADDNDFEINERPLT